MFAKKNFLIFASILLLSGAVYYFLTHGGKDFSKTYVEMLETEDLANFFADQAKVNKNLLKQKQTVQDFKNAMKDAQMYSATSEQAIMYWKDEESGYSSPIIWQKINGEWKIISL